MRSLRNVKYLYRNCEYFKYVRSSFSKFLIPFFAIPLACGYTPTLFAGKTYLDCFPAESAWENIQFETTFSNIKTLENGLNEHDVTLTFNNFDNYLQKFYGFAFLKNDIQNIPEITESAAFEEQFGNINMVALGKNNIAGNSDNKTYRFNPPTAGTWVIYLVATINKIPFLEQKNLRISPQVEKVRGGSIFSGSSLNLVEPIDYKACVIALDR